MYKFESTFNRIHINTSIITEISDFNGKELHSCMGVAFTGVFIEGTETISTVKSIEIKQIL